MGQFLPHIRQVIKLIEENKKQLNVKINQEKTSKEGEDNPKAETFRSRKLSR